MCRLEHTVACGLQQHVAHSCITTCTKKQSPGKRFLIDSLQSAAGLQNVCYIPNVHAQGRMASTSQGESQEKSSLSRAR